MPEDAHFPFEHDSGNDIKTVTGEDFYYNHALQLGLLVAHSNRGEASTANERVELESQLRDTFRASPYFELPLTVELRESDDNVLYLQVDANNVSDFEIPLDETDI